MPLSFISPAFKVVMIRQGEDERSAFVRGVKTGTQQAMSRTVTSLEINISSGGIANGTMIMSLPYTEFREFLDSNDFPVASDRVVLVQFGYSDSDDISPIYRFQTGPPAVEYQQVGQITWTLHGSAIYGVARETEVQHNVHTNSEKALGVMKDIASKLGYELVTVDEEGFPTKGGKFPAKLTDPNIWTKPVTQPAKVNDLAMLGMFACWGNANYYLDGNKIVVFDVDKIRTSRPVVTLVMWSRIDSSKLVYPIESFNVTAQKWFRPGSSTETSERKGPNPSTKKGGNTKKVASDDEYRGHEGDPKLINSGKKKLVDTRVNADGKTVTLNPKLQSGQVGRRFIVSFRDSVGALKVAAARQDAVVFAGQQVEVSTIGIPKLRPLQVVRVEGVGKRFTGNYEIKRLTHTIDTSGYKTSMLIQRTTEGETVGKQLKGKTKLGGRQGIVREQSTGAAGEGNTKKPAKAKVGERVRTPVDPRRGPAAWRQ